MSSRDLAEERAEIHGDREIPAFEELFAREAGPPAVDLPAIDVHHLETPAPGLAGGFKGAGEAGTAGAPAAILNAVNDAIAPWGARLTEQPLTSERVLWALRAGAPPAH